MPIPALNTGPSYLCWAGLETDLIFNHGVELPGFASFPLLQSETGRALLLSAYQAQADVAARTGCGACLESVSWMANPDRAAPLGYAAGDLARINHDAIALMQQVHSDTPICLSAQVGPRGDGFVAGSMTAQAARDYHLPQMEALAATAVDLLSGFTIAAVEEATGMVLAAQAAERPVTVSFTVETDGKLPDGTKLSEAIDRVDQATSGAAAYFLVNCAHPDHLAPALDGSAPLKRLAGVVANASRKSHAELDNSDTLDDGSPAELGAQLAAIGDAHPWMRVFGGCCGTDMRHLEQIGMRCHG